MRQPLALLGLILLATISGHPSSSGAEPVANGTFLETSADGHPVGWRLPKGLAATVDRDPSHPGGTALRVDIREATSKQGEVSQTLRGLKPNSRYVLLGQICGSKAGTGFLQVKRFSQGKELDRANSSPCGTAWDLREVRFSTEGADRIDVLCRTNPTDRNVGECAWFTALDVITSQPVPLRIKTATAVATVESIGLCVEVEGDWTAQAAVTTRYRPLASGPWIEAGPLVARPSESQFRGSLLALRPDTDYEIDLALADQDTPHRVRVRTWPERPPTGRTVYWDDAAGLDAPRLLDLRGTPDAWILIRPALHAQGILQAKDGLPHALLVKDAAYVIIEGLTIRGGDDDAVRIQDSHDVLLVGCDIAGWGQAGTPNAAGLATNAVGKVINMQSGVSVHTGTERIRIERNFIHAPRGSANSWQSGHPHGPTGISLSNPLGNLLVRDNDLIGNEAHWWNDGIEGEYNSYVTGGPHRDTDLAGNTIAFANDDGIELDGGQINVRCLRNAIRWTYCGVSCAPNLRGPSYVTRNVIVLGDQRTKANFGFKMGGAQFHNQGLTMLFRNTVTSHGEGLSAGHYGKGPSPILSQRNVYHLGGIAYRYDSLATFDHDVVPPASGWPDAPGSAVGCLAMIPHFVDETAGDYRLSADSPVTDVGAFDTDDPQPFPPRGGLVVATPALVTIPPGTGAADAILTVQPQAGSTWKAIPNSPWIRTDPTVGSCDGKATPLRILIDPSAATPGRRHRGAVTIRTDAGHLRTLFVTATLPARAPFALRMEAENGSQHGFSSGQSALASGGRYLVTAEGTPHQQAWVDFDVEMPEDGFYELWARCLCEGPDTSVQDSFFLSIDGSEPRIWSLAWRAPAVWAWQPVAPAGDPDPFLIQMAKGRHTVRFLSREPRARLDAVQIGNHAPEDGFVVEPDLRANSQDTPSCP